eukprot:gene13328-17865_t
MLQKFPLLVVVAKSKRLFLSPTKKFSADAKSISATSAPSSLTAAKQVISETKVKGSTFAQRLSAFLVGCGVGFGVSFYFIYEELLASNAKIESEMKRIDGRLSKVEGGK